MGLGRRKMRKTKRKLAKRSTRRFLSHGDLSATKKEAEGTAVQPLAAKPDARPRP